MIARNVANPVRRRGVGHLERLHRQLRSGEPVCRRLHAAWPDTWRQLRGLRRRDPRRRLQHAAAQSLPGPEEFYNGPTESNDPVTDPPGNLFTPVVALAGITTPDIDIIFNSVPARSPSGGRRYVDRALPELHVRVLRTALRVGVRQLQWQPDIRHWQPATSARRLPTCSPVRRASRGCGTI